MYGTCRVCDVSGKESFWVNDIGTAKIKRKKSWIETYKKICLIDDIKCSNIDKNVSCGCKICGAHVHPKNKTNDDYFYIVPLCDKCNQSKELLMFSKELKVLVIRKGNN